MRLLISIFKNSLRTIYIIVALIFVFIYVAAHYNLNGYIAKNALTNNLADYLGTEVSVGNAEVDLLNQIVLEQLLVKDRQADTLLFARRAMISFDILPLLRRKLEIHTIQFIDFDINLTKQDSLSDPNYKFVFDIFAPKGDSSNVLDGVKINSIILRSGTVAYNDYSKKAKSKFIDPYHLKLENISSNLKLQTSKEDGLSVKIKRLAFDEISGLSISKASSSVILDSNRERLDINNLSLSIKQNINDNIIAYSDLEGDVVFENMQLNADFSSIQLNIPSMLKCNAKASLNDILSKRKKINYSIDLEDLTITNYGFKKGNEFYNKEITELAATYIDRIENFSLHGSINGVADVFNYTAEASTTGIMSGELAIEGKYTKECPIDGTVSCFVKNLELKNHLYEDIRIKGTVLDKSFIGSVSINDDLCSISAEGNVDFSNANKIINLNADINSFYPYNLNLTKIKNFEDIDFAGNIKTNCTVQSNYRVFGEVLIDSVIISNGESYYEIPNITAKGGKNADIYEASLISSIFNVEYYEIDSISKIQGNINEEKELSDLLNLPIAITKNADFRLELNDMNQLQYADVHIPEALYGSNTIKADLSTYGESDSLNHILHFDYKTGDIQLSSVLYATSKFNPLFVEVKPCKLSLNNDIYECKGIKVEKIDAKNYDIQKFDINNKKQHLSASGIISAEGKNDLSLHMENLKLDTLFNFIGNKYLSFGGIGTGDILYTNDSVNHIETKNLFIKDFSYMYGVIGDADLAGFYDLKRGRIDLSADVTCGEGNHSTIDGYIQRGKIDSLDLTINGNKMRVDFLDYWLNGFLQEVSGDITGVVHLFGPAKRLNIIGYPEADVSFTNNIVGAKFFLRDKIRLTTEGSIENGLISLENAHVYDRFGQLAIVNASINHKHLLKYNYDLKVDIPETNSGFLLFDKPTHYNNELYWGQLYTSGSIYLRGGDEVHRIDVNCKTEGKSQFNLSPGEETYSDNGYNFLTFRDKKQLLESENIIGQISEQIFKYKNDESSSDFYIECDIQAQATENCQVYIQMDPLAEDRLICKGNGNISLHYDPRHDITIGGEYNITSGNYLITMRGDLMNKEFKIQNGSRVLFPGNFSNADLNINAVYSIPSVNLRDLDESFATMASMNRTTLPVDCKLAVTGPLSAPQIGFDIEVKNTSDDVQALVHNLIGTQEMLNREVFYLLLFSKFYTPEFATASQNNTGAQLSSFASSSLTSQLNSLFGHVSDNFTLGTNFRSDKGDFSDMEMDLSLSTRLWGDRLILNGNLGYRDPANRVGMHNNATSFIGDFDVEYLINNKGTLRAKAYSHYNERDYSINNALTTQGIGFIVRKDFKTIKELLFWKKYSEIK